jgi:hypothetical protein
MRVTSRDSLPDYLNSFNAKVAPFGCWQRTILDIVVSALIEVHAWEQRNQENAASSRETMKDLMPQHPYSK